MKLLSALGAILLLIAYAMSAWAHGTRGDVEKTDGFRIVAAYDDGDPISYGDVMIKSPTSDVPFQTGRTDRNGFFLFQPDEQGQWQIEVKDGMGHRLALGLEVGADGTAPQTVHAHLPMITGEMTRPAKIITGLSILFGLSGLLYGWKARRAVPQYPARKL